MKNFPGSEGSELAPYTFRRAEDGESPVVERSILAAFSQDSGWNDDSRVFVESLESKLETAFSEQPPLCVVVQHGSRIIGASLLTVVPDAPNHLLTGPCILHEYRSRGIGSVLLHASLAALQEMGLNVAHGLAPHLSPAAKYVYPKFGGLPESWQTDESRLAA
ncbi:MAG: GNAT family N-acetyltransferase [Chthoniobacterales bacterium]